MCSILEGLSRPPFLSSSSGSPAGDSSRPPASHLGQACIENVIVGTPGGGGGHVSYAGPCLVHDRHRYEVLRRQIARPTGGGGKPTRLQGELGRNGRVLFSQTRCS